MPAPTVFILDPFVVGDVVVGTEGLADIRGKRLDFGQGLDLVLITLERGREAVDMGVVSTGPVGEVCVQTEAVVKERCLAGDGVLGLPVDVLPVGGSVNDVTDGIDTGIGKSAVRVENR